MGADVVGETRQPITIHGVEGLQARVGQTLGISEWRTVRQEDIDVFAKLTGDEQWIHTDPERAATGPFGATVQHGFLTLGLATGLLWEVCTVDGFGRHPQLRPEQGPLPGAAAGRRPDPDARRRWPR